MFPYFLIFRGAVLGAQPAYDGGVFYRFEWRGNAADGLGVRTPSPSPADLTNKQTKHNVTTSNSSTMKFCKNLQKVVEMSDPDWVPYWTNYKLLKVSVGELLYFSRAKVLWFRNESVL